MDIHQTECKHKLCAGKQKIASGPVNLRGEMILTIDPLAREATQFFAYLPKNKREIKYL